MVVKRKVFSRSSLDTFCLHENKYPQILATPKRLLTKKLRAEDPLYLPFGYESRAAGSYYRIKTPFRCYPFVYCVNHENFLDHLNCLEWGFMESEEAMWLSQTQERDSEFSMLIFETTPGCEEVTKNLNTAFTRRDVYELLNIQLVAQHVGEPEFLYHQLMTSPNMLQNAFMYDDYTVLYRTNHPRVCEASKRCRRSPWEYLKQEETQTYLDTVRRYATSDYSL